MIGHRFAKIHRVSRSTYVAETHPDVREVEVFLRLRVFSTGIFTRRFDYDRLNRQTDFPFINPPSESPTDSGRQETPYVKIHHFAGLTHSTNPLLTASTEYFPSRRPNFDAEKHLSEIAIGELNLKEKEICADLLSRNESVLRNPVILTDCFIL